MERMDQPLTTVVSALTGGKKSSSKTINVGPIAVKLIECIQAIHERSNVVCDVKTANFMLATGDGTGQTSEDKLASRIRLLDLALAAQYNSLYTESDEATGITGTPLYASLNVHENKKPSRRDDLEAVGYVLAELLTKLSSGDKDKQLPWSGETSDEETGELKQEMVENPDSLFYKQLGDKRTISVFSEYLETVRGYTFKQKPDYDKLAEILGNLVVPRSKTATTKTPTKTPTKKSPRRTPTRKVAMAAAVDTECGTKRIRNRSIATQTPTKMARQDSVSMAVDNDDDEMDWEIIDENSDPGDGDKKPKARAKREPSKRREKVVIDEKPSRHSKKNAKSEVVTLEESDDESDDGVVAKPAARLKRRGVKVSVVEGPHLGESFIIEDGGMETFVLGSNPSTKVGKTYKLSKDKSLSDTHVRLDLTLKKGMGPAVTVTNKSKGRTCVNRSAINSTKAFIGNTIQIGNTTLEINGL
jgi:serine/threonine protein kinase